MKIAVASKHFSTVTPHAGRTRKYLIYEARADAEPIEIGRLELPKEMAFCGWSGEGEHPLDGVDVLIAGSFGPGFGQRLAARGILAVATIEPDPVRAVRSFFAAGGPAAFVDTAAEGSPFCSFRRDPES